MSQLEQLAYLMLTRDEGVRRKPYNDSTGKEVILPSGKVTIGVGRNLTDNGLSPDEIRYLFHNDFLTHLEIAERFFPDFSRYSTNRQLAILNLTFNLGEVRFAGFTETIAAIRAQDWQLAGRCLENSHWFFQVKDRAVRVITMLVEDCYVY